MVGIGGQEGCGVAGVEWGGAAELVGGSAVVWRRRVSCGEAAKGDRDKTKRASGDHDEAERSKRQSLDKAERSKRRS